MLLPVPILGRQPSRELDEGPQHAQRPKDGHHPVGRGRGSWPRRGEVREQTAGVVCPDGVSRTRLAALLSCLTGVPLFLPWLGHLSYCSWREISKGHQAVCLAQGRPGGGKESGRESLGSRLELGRPGSGETGLPFGPLGGGVSFPASLPACHSAWWPTAEKYCVPSLLI